MKTITLTFNKCIDCPYCRRLDFSHLGESYNNGFYCAEMGDKEIRLEDDLKKSFENYKIPRWCPL